MESKYQTNPLRMYAVVPEDGFLDDVIAVFETETEAEQYRRLLREWDCTSVVVPVLCGLTLVEDSDS